MATAFHFKIIHKKLKKMETNNQIIAFGNYSGVPMMLTFLDGEWWVTSPGMKVEPLRTLGDEVYFLCPRGGKVSALGIAQMLGKVIEEPIFNVDEDLELRIRQLKRLDAHFLDFTDVSQHLKFQWCITKHENKAEDNPKREVLWDLECFEETCKDRLILAEDFAYKNDAKECLDFYFEALAKAGIQFTEKEIKSGKEFWK